MAGNDRLWTLEDCGTIRRMKPSPSKSERMELRKAIGNRVSAGPYVPPYHRGPDYLVAHACFGCRKSWKLPEESTGTCPQCGKSANWMGRAFKAPKKTDVDQWKKVEALWRAGFRFLPNTGWREVEPYPEQFRDVAKFIADNPTHPFRVES
jgi:hypothetical protein